MQNLRADRHSCSGIKFTNGSGATLASGVLHKVQSLIGVVVEETLNAAQGVLLYRVPPRGVVLPCPADASGVFAVGDPVYYDAAGAQVVNATAKSGKIFCGYAIEAALQTDATVTVDLDGAAARGVAEGA